MSGDLGNLVISLSADMARFSSDMKKSVDISQKTAMDISKAFGGVQVAFERIGTTMAAITAGAGLKKIIDESVSWNLEAAKMAKTMGTTSEQASVMNTALHSLGIGNDVAINAALKLSKTLGAGKDSFDKFGIATKDSAGSLLPMPQIMANVNQRLLDTKTGTDRNIMALTLYGKSWGEMQAILKLTPAAMEEAKNTAERLHLIVGPDGIAQAAAYKKNMREVGLVAESMSIQLGNELLPVVVAVGAAMGESGVVAASAFGKVIKETVRDIREATVYWASFADKIGAWNNTGGLLGHAFSAKNAAEYHKQIAAIAAAEQQAMGEIAKDFDRSVGRGVEPGGSRLPTTAPPLNYSTDDPGFMNWKRRKAEEDEALKQERAYLSEYDEIQRNKARLAEEAVNGWGILGPGIGGNDLNWKPVTPKFSLTGADNAGFNQLGPTTEQLKKEAEASKARQREYEQIMSAGNPRKEQELQLKNQWEDRKAQIESQYGTEISMAKEKAEALKKIDQDRADAKKELDAKTFDTAASSLSGSMKTIGGIMMKGNKDQFAAGKAMAIASATIDTYRAAAGAYSAMSNIPYVGPALGAVAAAVAVASGMSQIAQISSMQYQARAMGGNVNAGQTYLVGEKGPELFTAGATGQISSNDRLRGIGGQDVAVTNVYQISTGVQDTVRAEVMRMAPSIAQMSVAAVHQAINSGGSMAQAVGRRS